MTKQKRLAVEHLLFSDNKIDFSQHQSFRIMIPRKSIDQKNVNYASYDYYPRDILEMTHKEEIVNANDIFMYMKDMANEIKRLNCEIAKNKKENWINSSWVSICNQPKVFGNILFI